VAVLPPLPKMLFWIGYQAEQAVGGQRPQSWLVLISGCSHPWIEQVLGVTERVLDVPSSAKRQASCQSGESAPPAASPQGS
jgi:hypothetical protein